MTHHSYTSHLLWNGSTDEGYEHYSRNHRIVARPAASPLDVSADPAFYGDPALMNPEQLLVMAASSCQLLSTLGAAARAGLTVLSYEDDAEGFMDDSQKPSSIQRITLNPTITVPSGTDHSRVRRTAQLAHRNCYIANSLSSQISLYVSIVEAD